MCLFPSFFFTSSSSLSLLPPLLLFTSFFHLHFLHSHTISSLENHFPRLLNLFSFISLNISSDLCVLDHLCNKPIFLKPISTPPFFASSVAFSKGPSFLTFNRKKYHPSLEWSEEERLLQDPKTHAPHSKKDFKVSSFFLCWQIFLILCFVESLMLRRCYFVVVCSCWNFEHCMIWLETLVWSCCTLSFGAFLNFWVTWYKTWTMLMTHEFWQCM